MASWITDCACPNCGSSITCEANNKNSEVVYSDCNNCGWHQGIESEDEYPAGKISLYHGENMPLGGLTLGYDLRGDSVESILGEIRNRYNALAEDPEITRISACVLLDGIWVESSVRDDAIQDPPKIERLISNLLATYWEAKDAEDELT